MTRQLFPIAALALLAACGATGGGDGAAVVPGRGADPVPCGAAAHLALIGQPLTALPGDEVAGPLRVIRPGDAVTEDFNPTRLNVSLSADGTIAALSCG